MTKVSQSVTSRINTVAANARATAFSKQPHIKALIDEITFDVDDRLDQYITSADRVRQLRDEFEPRRKQLKMTWYEYAREFLPVKDKNKLALLARISEAKTRKAQDAIVRVFRKAQNDRQQTKRDKEKKEKQRVAKRSRRMSKWRKALLAWARMGTEIQIQKTWSNVDRVFLTDLQRQEIWKPTSSKRKTPRRRKTHD
jgi:hypothetical protein